jgi:predicted DNA-binding transcriptional regulator AlpA
VFEVAKLLRIDRSTLSRWRTLGTGPRVTWLSPGMPRYQRSDVADWLSQVAG